jgi:two-component system OmpR family response regulator
VLDVGLPDASGFDVARRLRHQGSAVPILMLTARDAVSARVEGLDAGADDYLVKPFAYDELLARLRALARRPPPRATLRLAAGPIALDEGQRRVTVEGRDISLSQREFAILECLLRRPGQVLSRDQILDYAWPYGAALTPNTVEAYIHLLREKLGPVGAERIETVRGMGYRLRGD